VAKYSEPVDEMMLPWRFVGLGVFAFGHALLAIGCGGSTESEPPRCTSSGVPRWETVELPDDLPFQFAVGSKEPFNGQPYNTMRSQVEHWQEGELFLWNCVDGAIYDPSEGLWQAIPPVGDSLDYCLFTPMAGGDLVLWHVPAGGGVMEGRVFQRAAGGWAKLPTIPLGSSWFVDCGAHRASFYVIAADPWRVFLYQPAAGAWVEHVGPEWMISGWYDISQVRDILFAQFCSEPMPDAVPPGTADAWTGFNFTTKEWTSIYLSVRPNTLYAQRAVAGDEILLWNVGSESGIGSGFAFNPFTRAWRNMPTGFAPAGHIWSAGEQAVLEAENGWYLYDPRSDEWSTLPSECAPEPGRAAFVVWTDYGLLVWTGVTESNRKGYGRLLVLEEGNGWPQSGQ
jgi:hypothetical protein